MVKVSVIVPVYNNEDCLDVCLDSLINQSFDDFEAVCVNDGSIDGSLEILRKYSIFDKRIKVFSRKHEGLSAAGNFAFKYAQGKYVTYINAKDFYSPVALEKMYNNISENDSDFLFTYIFNIHMQQGHILERPLRSLFEQFVNTPVFNKNDVSPEIFATMEHSFIAKMYKREFIADINFLKDIVFITHCWLKAERISYIFEPLYFCRKTPNIIVNEPDAHFLEIFNVMQTVEDIFKEADLYEQYKTELLVFTMEHLLIKTLEAPSRVKRKMFNTLEEIYGNFDFSKYDTKILENKKIYHAYQKFLKKSYRDFRQFELMVTKNA